MFLWRRNKLLCLSGGATGDVVTSAVDDYNVDSRSPIGVGDKFSGNDGGWAGCGFPRAGTGTRPPDQGRGQALRLRSGTEPVPGPRSGRGQALIGEHCACSGEPRGMSSRVRLMIVLWIPAPRSGSGTSSAGMTIR